MPGGLSVLFTVVPEDPGDGAQVALLDLSTLESSIVLRGGSAARYLSTGHLVYSSGQALKAVAFDPETRQTHGEPVSLPDIEIASAPDNGAAEWAVSATGTLVFMTPRGRRLTTVSWVDRKGTVEPLALPPGTYGYPRISPGGTRVALDVHGANRDIRIWNLQRPSLTRLTSGPSEDMSPVWSRDGQRVFFTTNRTGNIDVYSQAADGATMDRVEFAGPRAEFALSFTPDGAGLLVIEDYKDVSLWTPARPDRLEPLLLSEVNEGLAVVSPDGNWIAYESSESGKQTEVFLRPFPNVSGRREKVSVDGGRYPLWGPEGSKELFYLDLKGAMMAASVTVSPSLRLGAVTKLFDWVAPPRGLSSMVYDISSVDGRFLMTRTVTDGSAAPAVTISVVLNWFQELTERVPHRSR